MPAWTLNAPCKKKNPRYPWMVICNKLLLIDNRCSSHYTDTIQNHFLIQTMTHNKDWEAFYLVCFSSFLMMEHHTNCKSTYKDWLIDWLDSVILCCISNISAIQQQQFLKKNYHSNTGWGTSVHVLHVNAQL